MHIDVVLNSDMRFRRDIPLCSLDTFSGLRSFCSARRGSATELVETSWRNNSASPIVSLLWDICHSIIPGESSEEVGSPGWIMDR